MSLTLFINISIILIYFYSLCITYSYMYNMFYNLFQIVVVEAVDERGGTPADIGVHFLI